MKKRLFTFAMGLVLVALIAWCAWQIARPDARMGKMRFMDLGMRHNEVICVSHGVDPFLVWKGERKYADFVPWNFEFMYEAQDKKFVHAYPPWSYTMFLPFAWLSRSGTEAIFLALHGVLLTVLTFGAFYAGRRWCGDIACGLFCASSLWLAGFGFAMCMLVGNYAVVVTAAIAFSLVCRHRGWVWVEGLCWSVAMIKPQLGVLFLLNLAFERRWRVLLSVCAILTLATLPPAILCGRSPLDMIFCVREYSQGQFYETGFIPVKVFLTLVLKADMDPGVIVVGSTLVGLVVFGLAKLILLRSRCSPLVGLLPALVLATVWSAARAHDRAIHALAFLVLAGLVMKTSAWLDRILCMLLAVALFMTQYDREICSTVNVANMSAVVLLLLMCWRLAGGELRNAAAEGIGS